MIWKNAEFHNVAELIENEDGSVSWLRMPMEVKNGLDSDGRLLNAATGVELRFLLRGEKAVIKIGVNDALSSTGVFHIFRGAIQGGWKDHTGKVASGTPQEFEITRSSNIEHLRFMTEKAGFDWDPQVIRIIFDRGYYKIYDIVGDIEPPTPEQKPENTLLCYGSSITHGSNSLDMSHSWVSVLAHNLNMDARNLGMAGTCKLEPAVAEYIASEGEKGNWDVAVLELGINVLSWDEKEIRQKSENMISQVASRNPEKPVFIVSPFCFYGDDLGTAKNGDKWRKILKEVTEKLAFSNVTYINGMDVIGDSSLYISADEVHPNIYGCMKIAEVMTEKLKAVLK